MKEVNSEIDTDGKSRTDTGIIRSPQGRQCFHEMLTLCQVRAKLASLYGCNEYEKLQSTEATIRVPACVQTWIHLV